MKIRQRHIAIAKQAKHQERFFLGCHGRSVRSADSDLRQLRFVTDMLMKLKARGKKPQSLHAEAAKTSGRPTM